MSAPESKLTLDEQRAEATKLIAWLARRKFFNSVSEAAARKVVDATLHLPDSMATAFFAGFFTNARVSCRVELVKRLKALKVIEPEMRKKLELALSQLDAGEMLSKLMENDP